MLFRSTMLTVPDFADVTLTSWFTFLKTLNVQDLGAHVGPSSASLVACWPTFSPHAREKAKKCLDFIIERGTQIGDHLDDLVDMESIPDLAETNEALQKLRSSWTPTYKLEKLLERSASDNLTVALRSLGELKSFMSTKDAFLGTLLSGDMFDSLVGRILSTLLAAACQIGRAHV